MLVRLALKGQPAVRWDHAPARVGKVLVYVLGQARLIGGDFWPGLMHATIFWGFVILTLGTIEFFGKGVTESFVLPFLSNTPIYLILEDLFSVLVIAARRLRGLPAARDEAAPPHALTGRPRDPAPDLRPHGDGPDRPTPAGSCWRPRHRITGSLPEPPLRASSAACRQAASR